MEEKDAELLSKVAANHLFLAQFEPFRATILTLRSRNPELAKAILQTIVARGGRFDSVLWSHSCSSPALLTFLCILELLQFNEPTSPLWSFDANSLQLRVEFVLHVQIMVSRVSESLRKSIDLENIEKNEKGVGDLDSQGEILAENEELKNGDLREFLRILDTISDVGLARLKPDLGVMVEGESEGLLGGVGKIEEEELMSYRWVMLENADVFDALSGNIKKQVQWAEHDDSGLALLVRTEGNRGEEAERVLKLIQRSVQIAHMDAIKECLKESDLEGAVSHIRFLHLDYGVDETQYRMILQDLLKMVRSGKAEYGDTWLVMRDKFLSIYGEALSSNCTRLIQLIQGSPAQCWGNVFLSMGTDTSQSTLMTCEEERFVKKKRSFVNAFTALKAIQDELLSEEIETHRASDNNQTPPPLERLHNSIAKLKSETSLDNQTAPSNMAISTCKRDMYHYARVSGLYVLECIMDTSLSAVKREQLQEASNFLSLFPRLQPLVAVMGWDLLSGKTTARRKLMQLLWTSKSQVFRLEESSLYGSKSDEVSCIEQLCDSLCYQLDLASFVACVNSGQSWSLKYSLLLSGKELIERGNEGAHWDPFVENFVLERLAFQSPLRVLFDVVPSIKFQDAIELISMQPITSNLAAWKRMQDIELMHMRYALESAVLALGAMERTMTDETGSHQMAIFHLKNLRKHLDAINNKPRKVNKVARPISTLAGRQFVFDIICGILVGLACVICNLRAQKAT
ncbi:unnamed protein product [Ilex paraguariensis]|uniref:Uncharacterized protein n=1 Tax=Ilex paraguariensis TaxID=185542 RepID=A0ABC8T541_9AQUA